MTDAQEVYEMVTSQKPPEPGALERQHTRQVRTARTRKFVAIGVVAAIGLVALIAVVPNIGAGTETPPAGGRSETSEPAIPSVPAVEGQPLTPGRYAIGTLSPLDESHTITIDVPDGYRSSGPSFVARDRTESAVSLWGVGWVFADACRWQGTASQTSSTDDVVAALLDENGLRVSTPTAVTIDGYGGTYLEVTVVSKAALDRCRGRHFSAFALADPEGPGGMRHLESVGEPELLWIVDVDGHPLVIDAVGTEPGRAELERMVASIQIDPLS